MHNRCSPAGLMYNHAAPAIQLDSGATDVVLDKLQVFASPPAASEQAAAMNDDTLRQQEQDLSSMLT